MLMGRKYSWQMWMVTTMLSPISVPMLEVHWLKAPCIEALSLAREMVLNSICRPGRLIDFIKEHVTQTIINEDLSTILPNKQFQQVHKILLPETLSLLANEQARVI
jgi:hypothetical protein